MLYVKSDAHPRIKTSTAKRLWGAFLRGEESAHSGAAVTLPYLIMRAEHERIPYQLRAYPSIGYNLKRLPSLEPGNESRPVRPV